MNVNDYRQVIIRKIDRATMLYQRRIYHLQEALADIGSNVYLSTLKRPVPSTGSITRESADSRSENGRSLPPPTYLKTTRKIKCRIENSGIQIHCIFAESGNGNFELNYKFARIIFCSFTHDLQ